MQRITENGNPKSAFGHSESEYCKGGEGVLPVLPSMTPEAKSRPSPPISAASAESTLFSTQANLAPGRIIPFKILPNAVRFLSKSGMDRVRSERKETSIVVS
jgi:hypothetical protein